MNHVVLTVVILAALCCSPSLADDANNDADPNDVQFFLFPDKSNLDSFDEIQYNVGTSVSNSRFRSNSKTVFITHGFRSNVTSDMPVVTKNAFVSGTDYNVIVTSWGPLARINDQNYVLAAGNVPVVADRLASFVLFLRENKVLRLEDVYLIGHSLGAHASGLAAKYIGDRTGEKIPRVTGLDPAGPLFFPGLVGRNILSDYAHYVDIIHTNMGVLGDITADGHADFYPNGGTEQTDCREADYANPATIGRCSHWFSYRLYAASITKSFPACRCSPFLQRYTLGQCSATCDDPVQLGFNSHPLTRGEFYLKTTNPP